MKEQWKEDFEMLFEKNTQIDIHDRVNGLTCNRYTRHVFIAFINNLLKKQKKELSNRRMYEQGRKELIEKILKDAPGDREHNNLCQPDVYICHCGSLEFNECNSQWMELINKLK